MRETDFSGDGVGTKRGMPAPLSHQLRAARPRQFAAATLPPVSALQQSRE
jgi:hypothetical protein